ncbi:hypothetical protein HanIR_Chr14g0706381 [Helianthus annuus]|nr:hypothetical protein HanIR_Chr14g0706381 [Helianthus annuus]
MPVTCTPRFRIHPCPNLRRLFPNSSRRQLIQTAVKRQQFRKINRRSGPTEIINSCVIRSSRRDWSRVGAEPNSGAFVRLTNLRYPLSPFSHTDSFVRSLIGLFLFSL